MAERLGRGAEEEQEGQGAFTQADMPFLRRRCLYEVVKGKLLWITPVQFLKGMGLHSSSGWVTQTLSV